MITVNGMYQGKQGGSGTGSVTLVNGQVVTLPWEVCGAGGGRVGSRS